MFSFDWLCVCVCMVKEHAAGSTTDKAVSSNIYKTSLEFFTIKHKEVIAVALEFCSIQLRALVIELDVELAMLVGK